MKTLVHTLKNSSAIFAALGLLFALPAPAAALVTFEAGTPAKASEVNSNFTELSNRIDDLASERGSTINVDCETGGVNALQSAVADALPGSEIIVKGLCAGPVAIDRDGITLSAQTPGTDGIFSDGIDQPVLQIKGGDVSIEEIKISIIGGTEDSIGLSVLEGGVAIIDNVTVVGAGDQLGAYRAGTLTLRNTTNIVYLIAADGGHVRLEGGNGDFNIIAKRGSSVDIRTEAGGSNFNDVQVRDASTLQVARNVDPITINGTLEVVRGANVLFRSPVVVNFNDQSQPGVKVFQNSSLEMRDATINTMTDIVGSSGLRACGSDFNDPNTQATNDGLILMDLASALVLQPCYSETGNDNSSAGAVEVDGNSSAEIIESTLNGYNDGDETYAIDLVAGGQINLENSTVEGNIRLDAGGILEADGSNLDGNLFARGNSTVLLENSSLTAMRSLGGGCLGLPHQGIRLYASSALIMGDSEATIEGYLYIDSASVLQANPETSFWNVDALSYVNGRIIGSPVGINECSF